MAEYNIQMNVFNQAEAGYDQLYPVNKNILTTITISPTWTGASAPYTQTFTVTGVTATNTVEVFLPTTTTADGVAAFQALNLQGGAQSVGSFTLRAFGELNTASITANVLIRNDI